MTPVTIEAYGDSNVKVACYQAKAEAIKNHVDFKEGCGR